jgi:aconitate hydratase
VKVSIKGKDGAAREINVRVRIDTADELSYFRHGGILHYVVRSLAS